MALLLPNVGVAAIGPSNKYFQVLGLISKLKSQVVANCHFMYMGKFPLCLYKRVPFFFFLLFFLFFFFSK
jgi:hypothetical protein